MNSSLSSQENLFGSSRDESDELCCGPLEDAKVNVFLEKSEISIFLTSIEFSISLFFNTKSAMLKKSRKQTWNNYIQF